MLSPIESIGGIGGFGRGRHSIEVTAEMCFTGTTSKGSVCVGGGDMLEAGGPGAWADGGGHPEAVGHVVAVLGQCPVAGPCSPIPTRP